MSDENRLAEYTRVYGVKETLVHEKADSISLYKGAFKRLLRGKRIVKREGDVPRDKGKTVTVTDAQYKAYTAIVESMDTLGKDTLLYKTLRDVGFRESTLKSLEKLKLITIHKKKTVTLWKRSVLPTNEMEKYRAK